MVWQRKFIGPFSLSPPPQKHCKSYFRNALIVALILLQSWPPKFHPGKYPPVMFIWKSVYIEILGHTSQEGFFSFHEHYLLSWTTFLMMSQGLSGEGVGRLLIKQGYMLLLRTFTDWIMRIFDYSVVRMHTELYELFLHLLNKKPLVFSCFYGGEEREKGPINLHWHTNHCISL